MPQSRSVKEGRIPAHFFYDEDLRLKYPLLAGIDEAGRGPLAGPVVASAVILPSGLLLSGLRDSKVVSERVRQRLFWDINREAVAVGVGMVGADEIDDLNILRATKLAMRKAVEDLGMRPDLLVIDAVQLPGVPILQESLVRGESRSASIAAASIIAKVVRDDIMLRYHETYPMYNFKRHKGYPTREHIDLLRVHGPSPLHRRSFRWGSESEPTSV
jgi:ribonuclease HII